ncbi:MAG: hypothetical protein KDA87_19345 [Planctomycetales bacterium]|nr:hypothetical protein [Planctomycetales bacterium]
MVTLADSLVSSATRRLPVRMRPDLSMRYHRYQGKPFWVVKEPIGLKYYRFQEEEFSILQMLDGTVSYQDIKEQFEREFAPQKISLNDLQHFIGMLHRSGLLITDAEGQGKQLKRRGDTTRRKELLSKFSNVLALRFKGIDPENLLNRMAPYTNWYFTKWALMGVSLLALSALLLVGVKFEVFRARLPAFHEFFGPQNWIYLGTTLAITKVLHEFGHGLSCKRFGGECHEMGVMFLVLTPCLYCNVSDSWLLPNKWHRAVIGAAGMYVEITLASMATFLWWFSEEATLVNQISLSVMFICSVSTLMFNGNPLLRFDGYYIMSDLAEIPNLRQKSSRILQRVMSEWCLGIEQQEDPFLPQTNRWFFALYTIAAVIYRWIVVFSILMFLNQVLKPYGLQALGQLIAMGGLFGLVVQPAWQFGKFLHVPGRMHQVKKNRVAATVGILLLLIGAFCYIPLPYSVKCAVQLQPKDSAMVYATVPGVLKEVLVKQGDVVEKDNTVIAQLVNEDIVVRKTSLESELQVLLERQRILQRQRTRDPSIDSELDIVNKRIQGTRNELAKEDEALRRLTVYAPANGTIYPAPNRKPQPAPDGQLESWSGSLLDKNNLNATLEPNDVICLIADPLQYEAMLAVDQSDIRFINAGQEVHIKLDPYAYQEFESEIKSENDISRREMEAMSESMSFQAGGGVATKTDKTGVQRPLSATFPVFVPLEDTEGLFQPGLRGRARIKAKPQSLGQRVWRYITKTFHFEL